MKKLLFFVAALFSFSFAQAQGIKLGLKAGPNLSNITISGQEDEDEEAKSILGFHVGAFLDYGISDMVSIRPELLYSMKGFKYEESEQGTDFKLTTRFHYLDVPVLAHINAGGLFFELGPTIGFKLSSSTTLEIDGKEMESDDDDEDDDLSNIDFGYAAGLGYQLENGFGLGLRYQGGLSNLIKDSEDEDVKIRNSVFQLSLSYTFGGR